jgi:predicted nucleic acid-binding protein
LTARQALEALSGLRASLTLVPVEALAEQAFEIADASSITIYDALYVAAAGELDCALVTADARLVRALSGTRWEPHAVLLQDWASRRDVPPLQP